MPENISHNLQYLPDGGHEWELFDRFARVYLGSLVEKMSPRRTVRFYPSKELLKIQEEMALEDLRESAEMMLGAPRVSITVVL